MLFKKSITTNFSGALLVVSLSISPAYAGIPVVDLPRVVTDVAEFLATYYRYKDKAKLFVKQSKNLGNFQDLLNSTLDKETRKYLPVDLLANINAVANGNYSGTKLIAELDAIALEMEDFKTSIVFVDNPDTAIDESDTQEAKTYHRRKGQTMLGMAVAEKVYNENDRRLDEINQLIEKIADSGSDSVDASMKYSGELRNRMISKNSVIATEQLQVQALILKALTEQNNRANEEEANSTKALRNNLEIFN